MICGCGNDLVKIQRMSAWLKKPGLLKRFFHENELSYVLQRKKNAAASLAARFAAKEAFGKALGSGLAGIHLKEIEVRNTPLGKPELFLYGKAAEAFHQSGASKIHLSLSHDAGMALAFIILEH